MSLLFQLLSLLRPSIIINSKHQFPPSSISKFCIYTVPFLVIFSSSIYILKNRSFNSLGLCLTVFYQFCLKLGLTQGGVSDRSVKKGKGRARSKMLSRLVMTAGTWLLCPGGQPGKLHECLIAVHPGEERGKNVPTSSGLSPSPVDRRFDSWVLTPLHFQVHIHEG